MLSKSMLEMAKRVIETDINYGKLFAKVPIRDPDEAVKQLEAGDILIQFAPQLRLQKDYYNEYVVKGCMHLSTVAMFGGRPFKIELMQQGLFVVDDIFGDLEGEAIYLKRYNIVLRHKKVHDDPKLRQALNESLLRFSGFEDHGGVPVRTRRVFVNFFMKTNRLEGKKKHALPKKVYCSEITYHAYRENGIEVCKLHTMDELLAQTGGLPDRETFRKVVKRYTKTSMMHYHLLLCAATAERLGIKLHLPFLRPTRYLYGEVVWPQFILENRQFDIVAVVPPAAVYITQWNRMLQNGEGLEPEIVD